MEFWIIVGVIIVLYTLYLVWDTFRATKMPPKPEGPREPTIEERNEVIPDKEFTFEELARFNGKDDPKIYLAVQNIVFDVTESDSYKPGSTYHCFAGKDCSVALAKLSFDEKYMNVFSSTKLTGAEFDNMIGWFYQMKRRYPIVGKIKEDKKNV